ncbi:hypothetical protein CSM81_07295 [Salmonella enterica subsp. enterica serovar Infantis]|nr:hypothetical protein [Salmonella enterica subsp. enterica serovar Infantis]
MTSHHYKKTTDDKALSVFVRLDIEARRLGLSDSDMADLLKMRLQDYQYWRSGHHHVEFSLFSVQVFDALAAANMDLFYITTGVPVMADAHIKTAALARYIKSLPAEARLIMRNVLIAAMINHDWHC